MLQLTACPPYGIASMPRLAAMHDYPANVGPPTHTFSRTRSRFQGELLGPLRHGRGDHLCSSGDRYIGSWKYDKRDGKGRLVLASGVQYDGDWRDDKTNGYVVEGRECLCWGSSCLRNNWWFLGWAFTPSNWLLRIL